jgi:hypothetical protein
LELDAVLRDSPALGETEHLIPATVGQDGSIPSDKPVQASEAPDELITRSEVKVIGVAENDFGAGVLEILEEDPFDGPLRPDRHEGGRVHDTVRRLELPMARSAVGSQ